YREVLLELVRIDLEFSWARGQPTPLEVYQVRFPDLFECPEALATLAFEEYRLRCQAGEQPLASDYARRFGIDTIGWPQPTSRKEEGRRRKDESEESPSLIHPSSFCLHPSEGADPPEAGERFCGFQLLRELGRGAFARVFLARQDDLAQRPVVLKISTQLFEE